MCTAITFKANNNYFGRTLDLEYRYNESVVITPRDYIIRYKSGEIDRRHYSIIGVATVVDDYPLYYDATNEAGLSISALNFVGYSFYGKSKSNKTNIAPYELIIYFLSKCNSVKEVIKVIDSINVIDEPFNESLQNSELHWLISDKDESITLECMKEGIKIYDNKVGVLTNSPPFKYHLMNLNNYINVSNREIESTFGSDINLLRYSKGMNSIGLPGDNSSMSRFVRATYTKSNSIIPNDDIACVSQFFHILASVEQVEGSVITNGKCNRTQYISCCDIDHGLYYYKTYNNSQISCLNMYSENLDTDKLMIYPFDDVEIINYRN